MIVPVSPWSQLEAQPLPERPVPNGDEDTYEKRPPMETNRDMEKLVQIGRLVHPEPIDGRPRNRTECVDGPRPCPWAGCRYHLALDVQPSGALLWNINGEIWDQEHTCALDVAELGGVTLQQVANLSGITRERVRQAETRALGKLLEHPDADELRAVLVELAIASDARAAAVDYQGSAPEPMTLERREQCRAAHIRWKAHKVEKQHAQETRNHIEPAGEPVGDHRGLDAARPGGQHGGGIGPASDGDR